MQPGIRPEIHSNWDHLKSNNNMLGQEYVKNYEEHNTDQAVHKKCIF